MGKKKIPAKWLTLTQEQEQMIVRDFNNGRVRNQILREHKIPEGQFCFIILYVKPGCSVSPTNIKYKNVPVKSYKSDSKSRKTNIQ